MRRFTSRTLAACLCGVMGAGLLSGCHSHDVADMSKADQEKAIQDAIHNKSPQARAMMAKMDAVVRERQAAGRNGGPPQLSGAK